jgi:hypothetical protein
LRFRRQLQ